MLSREIENIFIKSAMEIAEKNNRTVDYVFDNLKDKFEPLLDELSYIYNGTLENNKDDYLKYHLDEVKGFENRLYGTWGKPLGRFEMMIVMCRELGSEVNDEFRKGSGESYKLEVLTRLHAHSLQISCEILQLLKGGYADGAMARWRSLHESAVISRLISTSGEELAERYYNHKHIDNYKFSISYNEHCDYLDFEKVDDIAIEKIKLRYDSLLEKYGESYKNDYGWCFDVFNKKKVTFYDIESFVGLSYLRPFYKFSSNRVHVGSKSISYKLTLSLSYKSWDKEILLSGPSNEGLVDPMQCTGLSLIDITDSLLSITPTVDSMISTKILSIWNNKLQRELVEANEELEKKVPKKNK
ncbi:DUF5677 domain-containing protein [Pectobacterium aroidearum]|uniref:DUF5677 domain-containing protein n=1 Tax=Pectobacterium aroidearum TaxID=1201031 RepID=UPI003018AF1C